jgi:DNA-binding PucR family transcriptional regulator
MDRQCPSEPVRELLRRGARKVLDAPSGWLDELDDAILSSPQLQTVAEDPVLAESFRRANRANVLAWAAANVRDPGATVPANVVPELLAASRDLVRRGLRESAVRAYRIGQNALWEHWMSIAFELTSDPQDLRELLEVSARSLFSFIDNTNAAIAAQIQDEFEELTRGTHAERREVVELIMAGAPISPERAASRLGYNLDQTHTAAVIWSELAGSDPSQLDQASEVLARIAHAARPLNVIASAATRWVWMSATVAPDALQLGKIIDELRGVRIAIGSTARGIEGFRRSHLDALATQRLLARLHSTQRIASFGTIQLVSLVTESPERADQFIKDTLGELETASPEIRTAVLAFVTEQCNLSRAAAKLYTHRNTLLRRLTRADELLPRPLEENSVNVAVALDVLRWRGG